MTTTALPWPKDHVFRNGDKLVMEGNLTSDDKPFSVIKLMGGGGAAFREDQYATFEEGKAAFEAEVSA